MLTAAPEHIRDRPIVLAAAAHPDDIEFLMAGTLLQLGLSAGAELHMFNIANGSCGSSTLDRDEISARRLSEARDSASLAGATHHPPIVDDALILYEPVLLARTAALVREIRPDILLVPSPEDYMEDHQNASRLMVTAAFVRGMRNFTTEPRVTPWDGDLAIYHALPFGLCNPLRRRIHPGLFVDTTSVMDRKRQMLACHRSQKDWLDVSQGIGSYLDRMEEMSREVGDMSGTFSHAEGWRRHAHFGFSAADTDPLAFWLGDRCRVDPDYEERLAGP